MGFGGNEFTWMAKLGEEFKVVLPLYPFTLKNPVVAVGLKPIVTKLVVVVAILEVPFKVAPAPK